MKLQDHRLLDAVCGEYIVGTLRGRARHRFEVLLAREPRIGLRLQQLQGLLAPGLARLPEIEPSPAVWRKLSATLELHRYRAPWHRQLRFWHAWAWTSTAALATVVAVQLLRPDMSTSNAPPIAQLSGKEGIARVSAQLSADGRQLVLHAQRPVIAGPNQSYELWLIPAGEKPIPVAVLGSLDVSFPVPEEQRKLLHAGSTLAVSTEPAGGSPTGQPTGTVILVGAIIG